MGNNPSERLALFDEFISTLRKTKRYAGHLLRLVKARPYMKYHTATPGLSKKSVKVAFIVQMTEIWDKEAPVFEAMQKDARFEPLLLVVPPYDIVSDRISNYGKELDFFLSRYGNRFVKKAYDSGWVDLEVHGFEYVFYQRCYETYLPEQYHTENVIRYAKTVYVPYAYHALLDPPEYYQTSFFDYLYMFFCCSDEQKKLQSQRLFRHVESLGYPAFEILNPDNRSDRERKRVLWTPRWTDDPETGGSTFIKYLDRIADIKVNDPKVDLWLRPHPMAFQNAVKEGTLTDGDVVQFHDRMRQLGIVIDQNEYVEDTLSSTDILITDFSSIVVFYFMSGRPLIYCADTELDYVPIYRTIIDCSYIAQNWEEVEGYVKALLNDIDPLKKKRELEAEKFRKSQTKATDRIIECILNDARLIV